MIGSDSQLTTAAAVAHVRARAAVLAEIDAVTDLPAFPGEDDQLDEHIPPELAARWARADPDQVILRDLVWFLTAGAGVLGIAGGLFAVVAGADGAAGMIVFSVLALVVGLVLRRRATAAPGGFSAAEVDLVLEHRRDGLSAANRWERVDEDAPPPREARAAVVAQRLGRAIATSPAWATEQLDEHRARFDPTVAVAEMTSALRDINRLATTLGSPPAGDGPLVEHARRTWDGHRSVLDQGWEAVVDRLVALACYQEELRVIGIKLEELRRAEELDAATDGPVATMITTTVHQELAAADLRSMQADLDRIAERLDTGIGWLGRN